MKLSNETLAVIKNFSSINQGIEFKKGNKLTTVSAGKTILAQAILNDDFPSDFCVYDLNKFIQVHGAFKDKPELDIKDTSVVFYNDHSSANYRTTPRNLIVTPPDKEIKLGEIDCSFELTDANYTELMKFASTFASTHIAVTSDGEKVQLIAFDASDDSQHTFTMDVGDGNGKVYKIVFKTENIKMVQGSYEVQISFKGLAHFKNTNGTIQYWVAVEANESTF